MLFPNKSLPSPPPPPSDIIEPPKPVVLRYTNYNLQQLGEIENPTLISTTGIVRGIVRKDYQIYGYLQNNEMLTEFYAWLKDNEERGESFIRTASDSGLPVIIRGEFPSRPPHHHGLRYIREINIHTMKLGNIERQFYFSPEICARHLQQSEH